MGVGFPRWLCGYHARISHGILFFLISCIRIKDNGVNYFFLNSFYWGGVGDGREGGREG